MRTLRRTLHISGRSGGCAALCRKIVPALHKRYIASMVDMFGESTLHCVHNLERATLCGRKSVDMENYYSRLGLDIIGKAVFNYDFDSLSKDDAVIEAVYTTLREAEHRSLCPIPYWKLPFATELIPRQVRRGSDCHACLATATRHDICNATEAVKASYSVAECNASCYAYAAKLMHHKCNPCRGRTKRRCSSSTAR